MSTERVRSECASLSDEITRLRAEVERLTAPMPVMSEGIVDWKAAYEFEHKRANDVEHERDEAKVRAKLYYEDSMVMMEQRDAAYKKMDEALAQVAVLAKAASEVENMGDLLDAEGAAAWKRLDHVLKNLPAEARALLDRLQRAEMVVKKALAAWEAGGK